MNSDSFLDLLRKNIKIKLFSDPGLHGGGWHIHANNGSNLNPHLDYTIHPKMKYQRQLNLIIYLEESYEDKYGGHLGFWSHDKKNHLPKNLIKEIYPKFNRAVIFDTSQNSWHGLSTIVKVPKNKLRKSIAVYYLSKTKKNHLSNSRALFALRDNQKKSKKLINLIRDRADEKSFHKTYKRP